MNSIIPFWRQLLPSSKVPSNEKSLKMNFFCLLHFPEKVWMPFLCDLTRGTDTRFLDNTPGQALLLPFAVVQFELAESPNKATSFELKQSFCTGLGTEG